MKNLIALTASVVILSTAPSAMADRHYGARAVQVATPAYSRSTQQYSQARGNYDFARVTAVRPIVRLVTVSVPRRECWNEEVRVDRRRSSGTAGATIAGGLLGGVIGRQFGDGSGRDALTVVGALVGSAIGNDAASSNRRQTSSTRYETVQRCEVRDEVREEERIDGYEVTYLYNGQEYTTRTRNDPGDRIRVRVSVNPAGRY